MSRVKNAHIYATRKIEDKPRHAPQDAVVSNVKRLRAEVRTLAKRVKTLEADIVHQLVCTSRLFSTQDTRITTLERAYRDVALVLLVRGKKPRDAKA